MYAEHFHCVRIGSMLDILRCSDRECFGDFDGVSIGSLVDIFARADESTMRQTEQLVTHSIKTHVRLSFLTVLGHHNQQY